MPQPPVLPDEALARVYRLARLDGTGVLLLAGIFALLAAARGDTIGALTGLIVAGAGAMELHGAGLLNHADPRGVNWLIGSQFVLLAAVLAYCGLRLLHPELPPLPPEMNSMVELSAQQLGMTPEEYLRFVYRSGIWIVAGASILYQGSMILYYLRRRHAVFRALGETL